eukprot:gene1062-1634_t
MLRSVNTSAEPPSPPSPPSPAAAPRVRKEGRDVSLKLGVAVILVLLFLRSGVWRPWVYGPPEVTWNDQLARAASAASKIWETDVQEWVAENDELSALVRRRQFRDVVEIQRVPADELSLREFFETYEQEGMPVVITNVSCFNTMWTRAHIERLCGSATVTPVAPNKQKGESWGDLQPMPEMNVSDFIRNLSAYHALSPKDPYAPYMHDWSIASKCPALLDDYVVPKYFAQDVLRMIVDEKENYYPFRDSWPSLFIGSAGTGSGLHIDSGDTHFTMYMIAGVKDFRIIRPQDRIVAYEDRYKGTFYGNLFEPNFTANPLLALATVYKTSLHPGDLLFVPGGSGHQVINPTDVISVSTNYVDDSNIKRCAQVFAQQLSYDTADILLSSIEHGTYSTNLDGGPIAWEDLPDK